MASWKENLHIAYQNPHNYLISVLAALVIAVIMFMFTDYATTAGNMGRLHANLEVILQSSIALFFGLNLNLLITKLEIASFSKKATGTTTLGAIFSVLVSGCPACSITLASYLGLASVISALPFAGLELKVVGLALLVWSSIDLLKKLTICEKK